jgi:CHAT domain-containing protein
VLELLPKYGVFHFAGHAVANGDQPELSYLALGSQRSDEEGTVRAGEIAKLRLSNLQLVVLSACSTLNPRRSRMGAIAGTGVQLHARGRAGHGEHVMGR